MSRIRLLAVVILVTFGQGPLTAQNEDSPPSAQRSFTTKDGDKLTARIVKLSSDGKHITLRSRDEIDHRMQTTALSLENQIFVGDWVEATALRQSSDLSNPVDLAVEAVVTKYERDTFQVDGHSITHEASYQSYRLKIDQPAAETRVALRVSYLILHWQKIAVYKVADGERTDWSSLSGRGQRHYYFSSFRLPVNRLAALQEKITDPIKIDRLQGQTEADRLGHDQLIGIHVRAEDPFGNVVAEFSDLPEPYARLGWSGLNAARQGEETLEEALEDPVSERGVLKLPALLK